MTRIKRFSTDLERRRELPFQVDGQTDRNLVPREASTRRDENLFKKTELEHSHVLGRHLFLIFSESIHPAEGDIGISDVMLTSWHKLQIVTLLQDSAVVCGDVEAKERGALVYGMCEKGCPPTIMLQCKPFPGHLQ